MQLMKKALITGVTGQDGSYLAELLLEKDYEIHAITRRTSISNTGRIDHLLQDPKINRIRLFLHYGDLGDSDSITKIVTKVQPDEIYHLGAMSHVRVSFDIPVYTGDITALGTVRMLEAVRKLDNQPRFYQASSSELFGKAAETPQKETTPFHPRSPYAVAKLYSYWATVNYRESYGLFASNGILFNHESPRRGENFVSRKITRGLVRIKLGLDEKLQLGNLEAKRDWGYAKEYVEGMWRMLQHSEPDDFVLATGEAHSVREFVEAAAKALDFDIEWEGKGIHEKGIDKKTNKVIVEIDERYLRPAEADAFQGDCSKAKAKLGWEPKVKFNELAELMAKADLEEQKG